MPNFTKSAIKNAFWALLDERPLSKITVRDIVERCGINRNSFYYHFRDIPALLDEIIVEWFDDMIKNYPTIDQLEDCCDAMFDFAAKHRRALMHIYTSAKRYIFEGDLMRFCEYAVTTYLNTAFDSADIADEDKEIVIRFLKHELFGAVIDWAEHGMPQEETETVQRMLELSGRLSEDLIKRYGKQID